MDLKNKAAIYIRVSTSFQIDKDSLQVQKRELAAYAELVLGIREYDVFEDPGYSGKDTSRPAYQMMMSRLRTGEYSHLLVWKIDRISRNLLDFASMYAELKQIGVTFVSKNEQFDTSTAIGEAMLKIILVFAELERNMTAERVTAVMLSRASNGQWNGGRVPYGYDWDSEKKEFRVNEKEAEIYRFICSLYEEKQSLLKVCEELNGRGLTTKTGRPWNIVGVHKLLTNVFYEGIYRYNVHSDGRGGAKRDHSEWINIDNHHPALIDMERFDRIGYMLKRNARNGPKKGDTYTGKAVHVFAGLLVCGICGMNMTATQDRRRADGYRPSMYGCAARRRNAGLCRNKYVNDLTVAPEIFAVVSAVLSAVGRHDADAEWIEKRIMEGIPSAVRVDGLEAFAEAVREGGAGLEYHPPEHGSKNDELQALRERKKRCETSLKRLQSIFIYGEGGISEKDYMIERKRITDELAEIDNRLQKEGIEEKSLMDSEFQERASYFIMVDHLTGGNPADAGSILKALDPSVPKNFMRRILDHASIKDGHVTEICFRSGLTMRITHQ